MTRRLHMRVHVGANCASLLLTGGLALAPSNFPSPVFAAELLFPSGPEIENAGTAVPIVSGSTLLIEESSPLRNDLLIAQIPLVSGTMQDTLNKLQEMIDSASREGSVNSFEVYTYLTMLLSQIQALLNSTDASGNKLADKVFSNLETRQREALIDFQNSVNTLANERNLTSQQVKDVIDRSAVALSVLPGSKSYPRILRISPFYISRSLLQDNVDDSVPISVDGMFLKGDKSSELSIGGQSCSVQSESVASLAFTCPKSLFLRDKSITTIDRLDGSLTVFDRRSLLDRIFRRTPKAIVYKAGITVLPLNIGHVTVVSHNNPTVRRIDPTTSILKDGRKARFRVQNGYCASAKTGIWTIPKSSSSPSVVIDTSLTPQIRVFDHQRRATYSIQQVTDSVIRIDYRIDNDRSSTERACCSSGMCNDRRASLGIEVNYVELVRRVTPGSDIVITPAGPSTVASKVPLAWGKDLKLTLPTSSKSFTMTVDLFDGQTVVITPANMGNSNKYFRVTEDNPSKTIVVSPIPLEQLK